MVTLSNGSFLEATTSVGIGRGDGKTLSEDGSVKSFCWLDCSGECGHCKKIYGFFLYMLLFWLYTTSKRVKSILLRMEKQE